MADPTTKTRRRTLRFSLRTLLMVVTLSAACFGYLTYLARRASNQQRAVEMVLAHHGNVSYLYQFDMQGNSHRSVEPSGPKWLRNLLGRDYFDTVTYVDINSKKTLNVPTLPDSLTDDEVDLIAGLDSLVYLRFFYVDLTDAQLARLKRLRHLRTFVLRGSNVTDQGLETIGGFSQLRNLLIDGGFVDNAWQPIPRITDLGIRQLNRLTHLEQLHLTGTRLSDQGLSKMAEFPKLYWLGLGGTQVSDAGLPLLIRYPALLNLNLGQTAVTDKGLQHLEELTTLKRLWLESTEVSDQGLKSIAQLPNLINLDVEDTRVTVEGIDAFKTTSKAVVHPPQMPSMPAAVISTGN